MRRWLVDGYNVLHACILHGRERTEWWRPAAQAQVLFWVDDFAGDNSVVVVFDSKSGAERVDASRARAEVRFASHADDELVRMAELAGGLGCVVSADRALGDRCAAVGCAWMRPWTFQALLSSTAFSSSRVR